MSRSIFDIAAVDNPFVFGRPLEENEPFFNRGHELAWLIYSAQRPKGHHPLILTGAPGTGKSSLVNRLAVSLENEKLILLVLNSRKLRGMDGRDFLWYFYEQASSNLTSSGFKGPELERRQLILHPLIEFKEEYWSPLDALLSDNRLLVIFDEADILFDLDERQRAGRSLLDIILELYRDSVNIEFLLVLEDAGKGAKMAEYVADDGRILELGNFELDEALSIVDQLHPFRVANDVIVDT